MSDRAKLTGYPDHETVRMAIAVANAARHGATAEVLGILRDRLATADATVAALTAENERLTGLIRRAVDRYADHAVCKLSDGYGDPCTCGYEQWQIDAAAALPSSREPYPVAGLTTYDEEGTAPPASGGPGEDAVAEACAAVCENRAQSLHESGMHSEANEAHKCAMAIRARLGVSPLRPVHAVEPDAEAHQSPTP